MKTALKLRSMLIAALIGFVFTFSGNISAMDTEAELKVLSRDETVYATLRADGRADKISVVVHLVLEGTGEYRDASDFKRVTNLSNSIAPEPAGDGKAVIWRFDKAIRDFYYEGELENARLPFEFNIAYELDGQAIINPAGISGKLRVTISVEPNSRAPRWLRDNFMCQLQLPMDMEKCADIKADNAVSILTGTTKTLSYTVLPGNSAKYEISADVRDFSSGGFDITLLSYSFSSAMSMDAAGGAMENARSSLEQAREEINGMVENAGLINTGLAAANSSLNGLNTTMGRLNERLIESADALRSLKENGDTLGATLDRELDSLGQLSGLGNLLSDTSSQMSESFSQMYPVIFELTTTVVQSRSISDAERSLILAYLDELSQTIVSAGEKSEILEAGISQYTGAVSDASGAITRLSAGLRPYMAEAGTLSDGFTNIVVPAYSIHAGLTRLSETLGNIRDEFPAFSSGLRSAGNTQVRVINNISGLTSSLMGNAKPAPIVSFTNGGEVSSLQCVLKTREISLRPERERIVREKEEPKSILQKIIDKIMGIFR